MQFGGYRFVTLLLCLGPEACVAACFHSLWSFALLRPSVWGALGMCAIVLALATISLQPTVTSA
eukprot:5409862-Amphidinium_carterae.1